MLASHLDVEFTGTHTEPDLYKLLHLTLILKSNEYKLILFYSNDSEKPPAHSAKHLSVCDFSNLYL